MKFIDKNIVFLRLKKCLLGTTLKPWQAIVQGLNKGVDAMNAQQHTQYLTIKNNYKTEPRWLAAQAVMADPSTEAEEYASALAECSKYERYAAKAAESARIGGL